MLKEKTSNFEIKDIDMPRMHGKTDIVLKNVKTGLVERIHSENTFQGNHIAKYLRSLGTNNTTNMGRTDQATQYPLWKHAVGGLFLFSDSIEEGTEYMPAGNIMVGAGVSEMTHTGSPSEWGSFNANESSSGLNGITQVYDFATDQANGTISCVCLTSRLGAEIGYGHNGDSYLYASSPWTIENSENAYYGEAPSGWLFKDSNTAEWIIKLKSSASSYYNIVGGKLYVSKRRYGVGKLSVFNSLEKEISFDLTDIGTNPHGITSNTDGNYYAFPYEDTKFIVCVKAGNYMGSVAPNNPIYYYILDIDAETLTLASVINSTGQTIRYQANGRCAFSITADKCMIVCKDGSPYTMYKIRLSDGVLLKTFTGSPNGIGFYGNYLDPTQGCYGQDIVPGLQVFYEYNNYNHAFVYDRVGDTLKRINMNPNNGSIRYNPEYDLLERNQAGNTTGSSNNAWLANNPLYLATINNLQSAVTKTAAQTMKVTYTLTEA